MSRKLVILFAVLAIAYVANGTAGTASPSSAYSVAVGNVFTNATDTAFTNLQNDCYFTAGFDNTTNYVWCNAGYATDGEDPNDNYATSWASWTAATPGTTEPSDSLEVLTLQRRAINASSPSTVNSTLDTKITTSITANDGGLICPGVGYLGIAYSYGSGSTAAELQSDVYLAYIAVNGSSATSVKLTSVADTVRAKVQACMFDNDIFYVVYTTDALSQDEDEYDSNAVFIQGVNVTSGTAYYNATGGVQILTPGTDAAITYSGYKLVPTNWTGFGSSMAMLLFSDSDSADPGTAITSYEEGSSETVGSTLKILPITLSTGAPGSVISAGVSGSSTTAVMADTTCTTTTTTTDYYLVGGFGSLTTYGVALTKRVGVIVDKETAADTSVADYPTDVEYTYTSYMFINGSSTVSTTFNMTTPSGYYLSALGGYSTTIEDDENGGFALVSYLMSTSDSASSYQINLDTYFSNGTAIVSATSLGTFSVEDGDDMSATTVQIWLDAVGSPWLGYTLQDTEADFTGLDLLSGYAGEIAYNPLSANALSSIFATLALMIAALFAF